MRKETLYTLNNDLTYTPVVENKRNMIIGKIAFALSFVITFYTLIYIDHLKDKVSVYKKTATILEGENALLKVSLIYCGNENLMHLTKENVDKFIDQLPFADKELNKNQYRFESGHLTSELALKHNNIYGMKTSKRKHTYSYIVNKHNYVGYEHWTLSVIDKLLYEIYVGTSLKNYSTNPNYKNQLK